jgi:hypothetical protein
MGRWWAFTVALTLVAVALFSGCELGWDFLKEGSGGGSAGAQIGCQNSRIVTGQFPPSGGLLSTGDFTADYSSPTFTGLTSSKALGLRVSRNRLWLNDLSIEVSFFAFDDTALDSRNGCMGRAILEINIPEEDLLLNNQTIDIRSTRVSQTEPSAFYAEGGDPGFTANAVTGTVRLLSSAGGSLQASFELVFNPGTGQRTLTNGLIDDDIDQNPAAEGHQAS